MSRTTYVLLSGLLVATQAGLAAERPALKPFEYIEAPSPLPNYVAGAKWGTQAEPIRTMQKPLDPAESMKHYVMGAEFDITLFAAEPDIAKPIWMAWDERGRLWVAETVDYPNNMQPAGEGHDRIKICEDTDGDGKADKFTIFADKLSVPTSFVFANGGIIVVHSGKMEFLKDTNGDDKADVRETIISGWGTNDTHAGPSNLRYGFDNWIWGVVGYSGFNGTVGGKQLRFGQGFYRFKPDGSKLEFIRSSNNNTWGLGFNEEGIVFGSTANGNASMYMAIPNRYYEAVSGWSPGVTPTIADTQNFYPVTEKVRQVDWHGKYTAGAGSALYTARSFPKEYWNKSQFVAEPTGHLLGRFELTPKGADFTAKNLHSFLASDDEWTSPICAEVGPDGSLFVIDWYNYIIQHNPVPNGFRNGKGNAYETPLRDKTHGRIYRIAAKNAPAAKAVRLDKASTAELVAALKNNNMLWRLTAQRLLVQGNKQDAIPALIKLARSKAVDEIGINAPAIHALYALDGLGTITAGKRDVLGVLVDALKNLSAGVRRTAVTLLPRNDGGLKAILDAKLLADADAQVRLATLLALAEMPAANASAAAAIAKSLEEARNTEDRWLPDAAIAAAARHDGLFLKSMLVRFHPAAGTSVSASVGQIVQRVTAHYAQRGPVESVLPTLLAMNGASDVIATRVLDGLVQGWPEDKSPTITPADQKQLNGLMKTVPESSRDRLLALSLRWGRADLFGPELVTITESLRKQVTDAALEDEKRVSAAKRLVGLQDKADVVDLVLKQLNLLATPQLASGLVNAVADSRMPGTGASLAGTWTKLTPSARKVAVAALIRRVPWAEALLNAIEAGTIQRTDLATEQWSVLKQNPNRPLAEHARAVGNTNVGPAVSADRAEIVTKLLPLAKQKGDLARGKEVYTATCAVCHTFNGQGGKIGPELSGIGARDRGEILTDILDPNRSVEANFRLWNVTTKQGDTFSGRLETETQTSVEILDTTGAKHVVQRKDIANLEGTVLSIMPNGFEALPAGDLTSLLDYLTLTPHQ